MKLKPLVLSLLAAGCLTAAVLTVFVMLSPVADGKVVPATSQHPITITLSKPAQPTAHKSAAGDYVHLANCQAALTGANGDHDINNFIVSHSPYGIRAWGWDGYYRYSSTDIAVFVAMYNYAKWVGTAAGECWGDDSRIYDNITGW